MHLITGCHSDWLIVRLVRWLVDRKTGRQAVLTSFADISQSLIAVVVIPSSPVIPLVHYTALFVFSVIVLAFFPILVSSKHTRNMRFASLHRDMAKKNMRTTWEIFLFWFGEMSATDTL